MLQNPPATQIESSVSGNCSWAGVLGRGVGGSEALKFIPSTMKKGKPVVHFNSNEFVDLKHKNADLVIGSFVGR